MPQKYRAELMIRHLYILFSPYKDPKKMGFIPVLWRNCRFEKGSRLPKATWQGSDRVGIRTHTCQIPTPGEVPFHFTGLLYLSLCAGHCTQGLEKVCAHLFCTKCWDVDAVLLMKKNELRKVK